MCIRKESSLRSVLSSTGRLGLTIDGVQAGSTGPSVYEALETPDLVPSATPAGVRLCLWLPGQSGAGEKHGETEKKGRGSPTYQY